jgi:putative transposase
VPRSGRLENTAVFAERCALSVLPRVATVPFLHRSVLPDRIATSLEGLLSVFAGFATQPSAQQIVFAAPRKPAFLPLFLQPARQKECQIIEGHLLPDHVHMCIAIPPKYPVASVIGFLKGKSAIAMARLCGKERNFTGEHFWARGYAVSTVGFELEQVRKYIRDQESADGNSGSF